MAGVDSDVDLSGVNDSSAVVDEATLLDLEQQTLRLAFQQLPLFKNARLSQRSDRPDSKPDVEEEYCYMCHMDRLIDMSLTNVNRLTEFLQKKS